MKSVTFRNLTGGFLGGAMGILSSWYVAPVFLPLGVFIGVVVGWWNEEIVHLLYESHQKARRATRKVTSFANSLTDEAVKVLARLCGIPSAVGESVLGLTVQVIGGCLLIITMLWKAPTRFRTWITVDQRNQVAVIETTILLLFVLGIPATVGFIIEPHLGFTGGWVGILSIPSVVVTLGGAGVHNMQNEVEPNCELKLLGRFYRDWEVISHHGWIGFCFYTIGQYVRYSIGTALFLTIATPWFLCIWMLGFIGVCPLMVATAFAEGFYRVATRAGHWLCLGVTMIVTGISWFFYHESFADSRIMWMVALGTGTVSGGITEIVRRVVLPFYENTHFGRRLAQDSINIMISGKENEGYVDVFMFGIGALWFRQNRAARILRSICFGFSIVRPL